MVAPRPLYCSEVVGSHQERPEHRQVTIIVRATAHPSLRPCSSISDCLWAHALASEILNGGCEGSVARSLFVRICATPNSKPDFCPVRRRRVEPLRHDFDFLMATACLLNIRLSVLRLWNRTEASTDGTARVWEPVFGKCLLTLQGHGWGPRSVHDIYISKRERERERERCGHMFTGTLWLEKEFLCSEAQRSGTSPLRRHHPMVHSASIPWFVLHFSEEKVNKAVCLERSQVFIHSVKFQLPNLLRAPPGSYRGWPSGRKLSKN